MSKRRNLLTGVRKAYASKGDDATLSRFVKTEKRNSKPPRKQWALPGIVQANGSIAAGRSLFHRKGVKPVAELSNVLVSGHNNVKIGRDVRKGPLRGYWIYTLSLEERRTCPSSCAHWLTCYGNNMPYAKRVEHGPELIRQLKREIPKLLSVKGRVGVLIRLHALGDFYSVEYVEFWGRMLATYPNLAIYGYTARTLDDPIGLAVARLKAGWGDRFAIRYSNGGAALDCTVSVRTAGQAPSSAIPCPEQTGATAACATCGLCWGTRRNIAFIEH